MCSACMLCLLLGTQPEAKTNKVQILLDEIKYLAHHVSKEGVRISKENLKAVAELTLPQTCMEI